MDGDLLLTITEQDLSNDLGMTTAITRKRQVVKKTKTQPSNTPLEVR